ncbi:MAG: tRNA (guanosine(37)-N1)-methyltransferase TrmD [Pseudomonadales bacterium]|nr:tRNA (guanosine(37)-N1)-methyltransferase TrmD [Pseudomonadales bacterium]MDG2035075.1 tRNA (guanosine(37)-N1)-methyltransferase TrmD [Pseudomonadales bacterium]
MQVSIVTLFPEMFKALSESGISSRAIDKGLLTLSTVNPRDYAQDKHKSVDDRPYGGGPGMVMTVPPLASAIHAAKAGMDAGEKNTDAVKVIYMSPQGKRLDQQMVTELSQCQQLVVLCGRYEGIDERLIEAEVDEEISIGDYVISGGELAAMVLLDGVIRQLPDALGDADSAKQDSFASRPLLDCPHYSRPESIEGRDVPAVLMSGDHEAIRRWRLQQSLLRTKERRPDLFERLELSREEQALLDELC